MFPIEATNGLRPMSPSHLIHKFAGGRQQGQCQQGLETELHFLLQQTPVILSGIVRFQSNPVTKKNHIIDIIA